MVESEILALIKEGFVVLGVVMAGLLLNMKLWACYIVGTVAIVAAEVIFVYPHDAFTGILIGLIMSFIACFMYAIYR